MDTAAAANPSGHEGTVKKSDDVVLDLIKLCHGLRDRDATTVLVAQINIGRKYYASMEENAKLRKELADREAHSHHMAGRLLQLQMALSAMDGQVKELKTRLVAKKALEHLEGGL